MALKYGRKNEIKLDPLAYNLALIGESGIGKTTVIKEYCEKLVDSEDGYLFLEMGKEDGNDAIDGLNFVTCIDWDSEYNDEDGMNPTIGFHTIVEDIVENRTTDWADLKVVVIDTIDELFAITEPEVIRMHNKENPNKRVKSIKAAFGGFMAGEDKAIDLVLEDLWALKRVGVSFIVIGHTKMRNQTDVATGEEYMQLTTNISQRYFNAIKTKVHVLGVASIDREIIRERTGKKNVVTGKEGEKGVVKSEARKITFRDDNFNIDSKSRFANIVPEIPLDSTALVGAITDAIKSEHAKSGESIDDTKKKQEIEAKKKLERIAEQEVENKNKAELEGVISDILEFFTKNKTDIDIIKPVMTRIKELGYANPKEINDIGDAKKILAMTLQ